MARGRVQLDYMQYPTIVGFPDFSRFSPWWEVSKTDDTTVGFSRNRDSVAVVHKISLHVECTRVYLFIFIFLFYHVRYH